MTTKERFKAFVAAYLVLVDEGKVLLHRRFNTGYQDGNYGLVSGHLEGNETTVQCIIREAYEEAGIILLPENLAVVHVMHRLAPDREYFDMYLQAEKWTGTITNREPEKCDQLDWFPLNNLPTNMVPEVVFALKNITNQIHFSEFGWPTNNESS